MPSSQKRTRRRRPTTTAALSMSLAIGTASTGAPSSRVLVSAFVGTPPGASRTGLRAGRGLVRPRSMSPISAEDARSTWCRCATIAMSAVESRENIAESVFCGSDRSVSEESRPRSLRRHDDEAGDVWRLDTLKRLSVGMLASLFFAMGGMSTAALAAADGVTVEPTSSVTVQDLQRYDGFEDYAAQGQQMENSDVGCFANECKRETASCFTDGSCLKGVTCLGRCKGEQECATRCFAQFGSPKLDSWLTCTLEDHSCVKIPKDMDFSAIDKDPPHIVKGFDAKQLQGTWFKIMGVNKKYDCFDCQKNTFSVAQIADNIQATTEEGEEGGSTGQVADIKVNFRLAKPDSDDFWENTITERLQVDPSGSPRTFHTDGKLFGLTFKENWYVTGQSTDPGGEFVFVQYRGHTLQGSYDGGFVYARKPYLPSSALVKVAKVAREHGIDPDTMTAIDNTCSLRNSLPRAGDTKSMNVLERLKYEASFVYDLMEWVHPGTIHKYASAGQKDARTEPRATPSATTTVANAGGISSSLKSAPAPRTPLEGDDG